MLSLLSASVITSGILGPVCLGSPDKGVRLTGMGVLQDYRGD